MAISHNARAIIYAQRQNGLEYQLHGGHSACMPGLCDFPQDPVNHCVKLLDLWSQPARLFISSGYSDCLPF